MEFSQWLIFGKCHFHPVLPGTVFFFFFLISICSLVAINAHASFFFYHCDHGFLLLLLSCQRKTFYVCLWGANCNYILVLQNRLMNFMLACGWHSKWKMVCVFCGSHNRWASPLQLANMISILQCLSKCQISWISNLWWSIQFLYVQKPRILWKQEKFNWLRYVLDKVAFISGLGWLYCVDPSRIKFFDWDNVSSRTVIGF